MKSVVPVIESIYHLIKIFICLQ